MPSDLNELRFDGRKLAHRFRTERSIRKRIRERSRRGSIERAQFRLYCVVQNVGARGIDQYELTISFHESDIRIRDAEAETLEIDGLYVHDGVVARSRLVPALAPESIRSEYGRRGIDRDYISFTGSLATRVFELVRLDIECDRDSSVVVMIRIDSPSTFSERQVFAQQVDVVDLDRVAGTASPLP